MDNELAKPEKDNRIRHLDETSFSGYRLWWQRGGSVRWPGLRHLPFVMGHRKWPGQPPKYLLNQTLGSIAIIRSPAAANAALWHAERNGAAVTGVGAVGLLQGSLTAFFASRQCPGTAIRAATDWALRQARGRCTVISGFHSPLEQSVLRLLVQAGGPAVVVLARPLADALLRSEWRDAIDAGKMTVVSRSASTQRLTEQAADDRNELAARLADRIAIAHASPGGHLSQQCARWLADQLDIRRIGDADAPH